MNIKKLTTLAALAALCVSLAACGTAPDTPPETTAPAVTTPATTAPVETTVPETTAPVETTVPETTAPVETTVPETTAPVETTAPETTPAETTDEEFALTGNWLDLQFVFDGVLYQIGDPYKKLADNGWSFDIADLGYPNGYVLNPGDKVYGTIDVRNDAYDKKISVTIGLKNNSDQVLDIYDCDIWSFKLQTAYAFKLVEPRPMMMIGNGVKLGDTHQQVLDACGPCEEKNMFVSDYGYTTYEYFIDFTYKLIVEVYDEFGVTRIELQDYSR